MAFPERMLLQQLYFLLKGSLNLLNLCLNKLSCHVLWPPASSRHYVLMEDYEPIITDLTKIRTRTELCLQTLDTVTKVVTQAAGGNPGQSSRPADIIM